MDDLPNKIRNTMGITAEVNLHEEESKYFIEIVTHPYSVPISVRGRYYYRSGSTKQELTGAALNEFLLKKSGTTWDDVIEARATSDCEKTKNRSKTTLLLFTTGHSISIKQPFKKT